MQANICVMYPTFLYGLPRPVCMCLSCPWLVIGIHPVVTGGVCIGIGTRASPIPAILKKRKQNPGVFYAGIFHIPSMYDVAMWHVAALKHKAVAAVLLFRLQTQSLGWCIGSTRIHHLGSGYGYGFIVLVNLVGFRRRVQRRCCCCWWWFA